MSADGQDAFDPAILIEVAGSYLLNEPPTLTRREVAQAAGVELSTAISLWRSLGFPEVDDEQVIFTPVDVEAIKITERLTAMGILDPEMLPSFVRAVGQSFARLADWQSQLFLNALSEADGGLPLEILSEIVPLVESVQAYTWRRHLASASSRALLQSSSDSTATPMAVGFVDIVGYTSRSRQLDARSLAILVDGFEQIVAGLVVEHGGQVIKTIGDEVLYTVDDPMQAGLLGLELIGRHDRDEDFPEVRVGTAFGSVLTRLGDVYGPVVNLASRLTSIARPGRALIDADLAALLRTDERFRIRRTRRTSVKGYEHLEPWALKPPRIRTKD